MVTEYILAYWLRLVTINHSIGMNRMRWFRAVLRSLSHSSLSYTFSCHSSPPTILPSSLTYSSHLFLGLPLGLVKMWWYYCLFIVSCGCVTFYATFLVVAYVTHLKHPSPKTQGSLSLTFVAMSPCSVSLRLVLLLQYSQFYHHHFSSYYFKFII